MTKITSVKLNLQFPTIRHAVSKISSRLKITNSKNSLPVVSIPCLLYTSLQQAQYGLRKMLLQVSTKLWKKMD